MSSRRHGPAVSAPVPGTLAAFGFVPAVPAAPADAMPRMSPTGRPSRNVARPNYAEASDESLGGAVGGRKRKPSASPTARRENTARPKFLLRMLNASATPAVGGKRKAEGPAGSSDEENEEDEVAQISVKAKGKALVQPIQFGIAHKSSARAVQASYEKYATRFLIASEELCARDPKLLAKFHAAMQKLIPFNGANIGGITAAMERVFDGVIEEKGGARIVQRIEKQLRAIGPDGHPLDAHLLKPARTPLLSACSSCKSESSFLTTICTACKKHAPNLTLLPYLDWRKVVLKQRQLDAAEAKGDSKKKADGGAAQAEEAAPSAPASPNKRAKAAPSASPASGRKQSSAEGSDGDLSAIEQPSAEWISNTREAVCLRAIQWIGNFMMKCPKENFAFSGGDIIFLLRNAIFKGEGEVAKQAREVVSMMLGRWDSSTCTIISDNSEPAHVLVFAECLHAKKEMEWCKQPGELEDIVRRLQSAVAAHCTEDILRFDATRYVDALPKAPYCKPCGQFRPGMKDGVCPDPACLGGGAPLRLEDDYEHLTESLVWTSLFRELGIDPVPCADAHVRFEHMLGLIKTMRPYRSLDERGYDSFRLQLYFLTHLTFVLTKWGACPLKHRLLFVEEYLFLLSNLDVCIAMQDAELVGEVLQALHILDVPHSHPAMQKGYHFLIGAEKPGKMRGNWVLSSSSFYQKYHAAYTGIIGLAEFTFKGDHEFPQEWAKYFM